MSTLKDIFGVELPDSTPAPAPKPTLEPVEEIDGTDEHFLFAAAVVEEGVREIRREQWKNTHGCSR